MTETQRAAEAGEAEPWAIFADLWSRIAHPLRPSLEDLHRVQQAWLTARPNRLPDHPIDVLCLGVTPEYAVFPWAERVRLHAIDASEGMIRSVWPGDGPHRQAVLGDWRRMPFADASFDLIVSDNGFALLIEEDSLAAVGRELRRLLRKDGRAAMRAFTRPARADTGPSLVAATEAGAFHNFHELKMRLVMALDGETDGRGVRLCDAWDCFQRLFPDREALARQLGCDLQTIATVDVYRGRDARYIFRPLAALARVLDGFQLTEGPPGHYASAECFPVFSLTPRP